MYKVILLLVLTTLVSCASGPYPVSSPYYRIPEGSRIVLKQRLTILPNRARIYIQYGKVVTAKEKDQYYPNCWFLSRKLLDTPQVIEPGVFTITKTKKYEDHVHRNNFIQLAGLNVVSDGGLTAIKYTTELSIHSDKQPDIFRFSCSYWEDPLDAEHLTVEQIQRTIGDIAAIEIVTNQE